MSEVTIDLPEESKEILSSRESASSMRRVERVSSAVLIHRDYSMLPGQINSLANRIMSEVEATDQLDYSQFVQFVDNNPRIMEVFMGVFHEDIWSDHKLKLLPRQFSQHREEQRKCCFLLFKKSMTCTLKATVAPSLTLSQEKSGWLLRKSKTSEDMQKVFVVLRDNMLLVYLSPTAPLATGVIFLEGCYIESLAEFSQGQKHGLSITHQYEGFKPMSFWTSSKDERDGWVRRLELAAKSRNVNDYYEFKERLGSGKFSDVYLAVEITTDFRWAVKIIEKKRLNEAERELLRSEISIMRLLNHPNVVEMKEVFEDKHKMYVVMELVEGGELFDRIRKKRVFSEYMAFHITKQLLETVKYLHEVGIVHRDIKPENILLSDNSDLPTIKVADFGLSKLVGPNDRLTVACGTLAYVAPEVLMLRPYSKPVDLWSIGVVCYLMVRGKLPFDSKDKQVLIEQTITANIDLTGPYWSKLTNFAKDFLEKLLTKDVDARLTCDQALNHNWVKNGSVLIPRKINRRAVEEDLMRNTITNTGITTPIYDEKPKSTLIDPSAIDERVIYTTPDIYEDMSVERRPAEHRIQIT